ncbi:MAG: hypothetical protein JNK87_33055 [Bryobacterales bacterium]|nr:hypothetical protein [Bryobacterales bacterium]
MEHASIAGLARELARVNGYGDRIEIIKQNARGWHAPEPVDLLVSECYGMAGVGGTMIPLVAELARRCLRPGGKVIPRDVSVWLAPVESEAGHGYVNCFEKARFGFDFRPAAMMARSNIYLTYFAQEELLARPQSAACVEIASATTGRPIRSNLHFEANRSGRLDGFAGWFESELCEGVVLRTGPDTAPTIWQHCFFPLTHPRRVEAGETIDLAFAAVAGESGLPMNFHWNDQYLLGSFPSAT